MINLRGKVALVTGASKGEIISFTKSLAAALGSYGITVNSVAPGWVVAEMSAEPLSDPPELEKINSSFSRRTSPATSRAKS